MSNQAKKTNPLIRRIGSALGLVTQEDIVEAVKAAGVSSQGRPDQRSSMVIGQAIPPDMKSEDYLKAYTGWVYSAVSVLAQETADIELKLMRRKAQSEFEEVDSHPVLDLLYKVNPLYTSYLLWEATEAHLDLVGEAFWWLGGPVNRPKEIWVLRPDWVSIKDTKGKLISNYEYGPPGDKKEKIPFEQVIHFKDFNPRNSFRGYGPVKAGAKQIDENNFQQDYSRNFFYNSALPAGGLQTDQNLEEDQYERIRDDWEATHRGSKKAWKIAILEAGLKWQDIGLNQKEMDFIEGRRLTRDEVLAIFRVPKPLLTFDDVNRAAAKEARAILLENVIRHKMQRITAFLNEFLLPRYGDDSLFFDFKDPVPNDQAQAIQYYNSGLQHGWLTRNEVREMEDLQPIEGGDKLLVPFSLQDIGAEQTPEDKEEQKKRNMKRFNVRTAPYPYFKTRMAEISEGLVKTCETLLRRMINKEGKVIHKLSTHVDNREIEEGEIVTDEARINHSKAVISRTDPREAKYKHLLTELFETQKQKVNNLVDQGLTKAMETKGADQPERIKSTISEIEAQVVKDTDVFAQVLMDFVRTVIEAEGIQQIQSIVDQGIFYMQTPEIQKYLKKEGVKFLISINEETAEQLRETLSDAIREQESINQIKDRVGKVYEDATGYRAERIARSEVLRATNFSTLQAYKQSKVVEKKEWLTAHDERTCPWCKPMDGKQLELNKDFFKEGDVVTGKNGKGKEVYLNISLGNVSFPPLHPNCRCTLIPIITEEEKSLDKKALLTKLTHATLKEIEGSLKTN